VHGLTKRKIGYSIIKTIAYIIFKFFFRLKIYGRNNIESLKSSFIIASNHQSYLDPIVLGISSPQSLRFIARKDLFRNFFGRLISFLGTIPVDLEQVKVGEIRRIYSLIQEGENLAIFPEGTRSPEGVIQEAQPGIGYLMSKTKIPVIPAFISGSGRVLGPGSRRIKFCKIQVIYGTPIKIDTLSKNNFYNKVSLKEKYRIIANYVMKQISELKKRI